MLTLYFDTFTRFLAKLSAAIVALMIAGIGIDVVCRNVLGFSIRGIDELSEYALYMVAILPAPLLARRKQHIQIDLIIAAFPEKMRHAADIVLNFLSCSCCAIWCLFSARLTLASFNAGTYVFKSYNFPEWFLYAPLAVMTGFLAVAFLLQGLDSLRGKSGPSQGQVIPNA